MRAAKSPARQLVRVVLLWQRKGAATLVFDRREVSWKEKGRLVRERDEAETRAANKQWRLPLYLV